MCCPCAGCVSISSTYAPDDIAHTSDVIYCACALLLQCRCHCCCCAAAAGTGLLPHALHSYSATTCLSSAAVVPLLALALQTLTRLALMLLLCTVLTALCSHCLLLRSLLILQCCCNTCPVCIEGVGCGRHACPLQKVQPQGTAPGQRGAMLGRERGHAVLCLAGTAISCQQIPRVRFSVDSAHQVSGIQVRMLQVVHDHPQKQRTALAFTSSAVTNWVPTVRWKIDASTCSCFILRSMASSTCASS